MPIVAIAGDGVYQAIAKVDLIVFNVCARDIEDYFIISVPNAHVCAHLTGVTAHACGGELNPCGYVPAFRGAGGQC